VKKYKVVVTPEAEAGIGESFLYIYERSPLNGERWIMQLYAEIDTSEKFPERCAYARERDYLEEDLRQLIFKSHRVVFQVDTTSRTVYVLHVRHSSRYAVGELRKEES
jgi:plasmid stabilization system protein ParE